MFSRIPLLMACGLFLIATPVLADPVPVDAAGMAGDVIHDVRVEGNQRVEGPTILSYLGLKAGSHFDQAEIDSGLKNLYATGFFSDIHLLRDGNTLVVRVVENPVINKVAFEGNDRVDTKDLEKEMELKPRSIYSQDKVQGDVKRILDIYRRSGRYNATVTPKIIKQDQNRVDLVYEITEGPVARVEKINFIGNEVFSSSVLLKTIRTEETHWYKFLTDNDKYDPDRLQYDQELLRRLYVNDGYADFQVKSAHAELSPNKDSFYITFVVEEGPKYKFGKIDVDNQLKEGAEKIDFKKMITTKEGDTYDASKIENSVDAMTKELGNRGYAFVDIQPHMDRDRDKHTVTLTYDIKPGPRVYVERIDINGNVRTLDNVVRREFRLAEGDPYNAALQQRSEQRLNNLGFFEKVNIKDEPGSAPDRTVIETTVQEKSTGEVNIGAGYSTTDGPLADLGISEKNLMGTGQEVKTDFVYAARRKQAELSYTDPYFLDREIAAGFDIYDTKLDLQQESSYNSSTQGVTLRAGYALQEKLQHTVDYSIREEDITDVLPTASDYIQDQQGRNLNSSVGQALTYDDRNNKFDPSDGFYIRGSQELAGVGGNSHYLKNEIKAGYYYSIAPKWVLNFLGSGGYVFGYGGHDVRIEDRFFLGGDDLRGFETAGVGPRDTSTRDALGGDSYYVDTTELHFPLGLPDDLGVSGALFTDVGSLWDITGTQGPNIFNTNTPRVSVGVGVLWSSPFGPIRIDLAKPIIRQDADLTQVLRFSFGTRF